MEIQDFFRFFKVIFALLDPDPEFECGCGSGSETLHFKIEFIFIPGSKRYHIPDPQHCCSKEDT
jgi:hypothetical protein